ncbi:YceI family protein [Moheibacter stercoris]|uniref:Polyisoprenoid-binding protein YceI n=1 Tax=Moheibacter stercoris TaxID=1628251 RepID=A0ABV2LX41_9FLAO
MKTISTLLFAILVFAFSGIHAQTKSINVEKSNIHWLGKKLIGQHEGDLKFHEGDLIFEKGKLVSGKFTVNMSTISTTDLEGELKKMLDDHLKSDDFFGVEAHPTAKLVLNKVKDNGKGNVSVVGEMTIKGVTNEIKFDMHLKDNSASAEIKIDRTQYGIKYGSKSFFPDLGDRVIEDIIELNVQLVF